MRDTTSLPSTSPELLAGFEPSELEAGLLVTAIPCLAEAGLDHPSLDEHPGTSEVGPGRCYYSRHYRRFVLELRERYDDLELATFARGVNVPEETLEGWLRR